MKATLWPQTIEVSFSNQICILPLIAASRSPLTVSTSSFRIQPDLNHRNRSSSQEPSPAYLSPDSDHGFPRTSPGRPSHCHVLCPKTYAPHSSRRHRSQRHKRDQLDRQPFLGGLKFVLEGWSGPSTEGTSHYDVDLEVSIQLPNPATPSDSLIVVTANHPEGLFVPIRFDGLIIRLKPTQEPATQADPGETGVAQEPSTPAPPVEKAHLAEDEQINALFKTSFAVKESSAVPTGGSVKVKFDDTFLVLQSADIESSNIVWTFSSLKMGTTQVIVTVQSWIALFIQVKTYNVHVFLPGLGENKGEGEAQGAGAEKQTSGC